MAFLVHETLLRDFYDIEVQFKGQKFSIFTATPKLLAQKLLVYVMPSRYSGLIQFQQQSFVDLRARYSSPCSSECVNQWRAHILRNATTPLLAMQCNEIYYPRIIVPHGTEEWKSPSSSGSLGMSHIPNDYQAQLKEKQLKQHIQN